MSTKRDVNKKVTLIVKTFERPHHIRRLIKSIHEYYPRVRLIVVDDSKDSISLNNCEYYRLSYDSGASAGRNYALSKVETPYFVALDDDFVFTEETKLELWLDILENHPIDLVAGIAGGLRFVGKIQIKDEIFSIEPEKYNGFVDKYKTYDITAQFFMANLDKVLDMGAWDEDYKTGVEHRDFFFRARNHLICALCEEVRINHFPGASSKIYLKARSRSLETIKLFLKKHNLKEMHISDRIVSIEG